MATVTPALTADEYIELERTTGERNELRNGEAIPAVGGSGNHSLIIVSISSELYARLKPTGQRVHSTEMRIAVPDGDSTSFTYADVVVPDGREIYTATKDTLTNPMLIVEVLSPSAEGYDRGEKFDNYCTIDTFREYLLVSQNKPNVTQFVKRDGNWLRFLHTDPNGSINIESLNCQIAMADIYAQVDFTKTDNANGTST
ncbi:MAG: Uma2 family endonuclease [Fuerstiella sp.]